MTTVTLGEFLGRALPIELAVRNLFKRLSERLAHLPELVRPLRVLEDDEGSHFQVLSDFRSSLPPELLARPCEEAIVRQLARVALLLEGDPLERLSDFQEAYEFIHELENCEVAPMMHLLQLECLRNKIDCSTLRVLIDPHLAHVQQLGEAAGDRARRQAIRL